MIKIKCVLLMTKNQCEEMENGMKIKDHTLNSL